MSEYEGREQSRAKHKILRGYLGRFAHVIGTWKGTITYVDCFSGPWDVQAADLSDSSFAIAVQELRKARDTLKQQRARNLQVRCFFLEEQTSSYARLAKYAADNPDIEIQTKNARLEDAVGDIIKFVNAGGTDSFPFFLIDPTGWTGFELEIIRPLLKRDPGEVLVNFMTSFIRRFINWDNPDNQANFDRTFGPYRPKREDLLGRSQEDLDDALVSAYSKLVQEVGDYDYICNSIILDPDKDSTQFNLIYGTRDVRGADAFKKEERRTMIQYEQTRATLRGAKAERKGGPGLFGAEAFGSRHYDNLRDRYLVRARRSVVDSLNAAKALRYDDAFAVVAAHPLVQEKDLKEWISNWRQEGAVEVLGLEPGAKVPELRKAHVLRVLNIIT